jgi:hypothetical protein
MKRVTVFVPIQLDIDEDCEDKVSEVVDRLEVISNIVAKSNLMCCPEFLLSGIGDSEIVDVDEESEDDE